MKQSSEQCLRGNMLCRTILFEHDDHLMPTDFHRRSDLHLMKVRRVHHCRDFFQYIDVFSISGKTIHSLVPEYHTHRGTCFAICLFIWEVVIICKSFVASSRTDSASDVHVTVDNIFPYIAHGGEVFFIASMCGHVGSTCVKIHSTYSMPSDFFLLFYRNQVLCITGIFPIRPGIAFSQSFSSFRKKPVGQLEIFHIFGGVDTTLQVPVLILHVR